MQIYIVAEQPSLQTERQEVMIIKAGHIVSHVGVQEWGVGKVLEVTRSMATIHFSDGINRKIAASHFSSLQPAAVASYLPPTEAVKVAKVPRPPRVAKKKKLV